MSSWKDYQQRNDKGQGVKKSNSDGTPNQKWLEMYRPNEAEKNKQFFKDHPDAVPAGKGTTTNKLPQP
jgi:hypothetical protein